MSMRSDIHPANLSGGLLKAPNLAVKSRNLTFIEVFASAADPERRNCVLAVRAELTSVAPRSAAPRRCESHIHEMCRKYIFIDQ